MVSLTRRAVLLTGAATVASVAAGPTVAAAAPAGGRLALNYQPSQPTGWSPTYRGPDAPAVGATIGGHRTSADFSFNGKDYRISLLTFNGTQDPVYQSHPADPTVDFRRTLQAAFEAHYAFVSLGHPEPFSVESYSVFADLGEAGAPLLNYGIDLYVVHRGEYDNALRWIQVVN